MKKLPKGRWSGASQLTWSADRKTVPYCWTPGLHLCSGSHRCPLSTLKVYFHRYPMASHKESNWISGLNSARSPVPGLQLHRQSVPLPDPHGRDPLTPARPCRAIGATLS